MADAIDVRRARERDLAQIAELYNYYVINTPITFDLQPVQPDERKLWFDQFSDSGRYQLFVAEEQGRVVGYADTHAFRAKAAYDRSVETTVYVAQDQRGRGIGTRLYETLFAAIAGQDLRLAIAGITLPNEGSEAIHKRFGFTLSGVMHEVGYKLDRYWDVAWYEKRLK